MPCSGTVSGARCQKADVCNCTASATSQPMARVWPSCFWRSNGTSWWLATQPIRGEAIALDLDGRFLGRLRAQKLITRGPVSHEDIRASMRIRRTARKAIADYVSGLSGIRARAGDRSEISHLQNGDRPEMPRKKQSQPQPTLLRPQDLKTAARPDFIDDIVRELTEGE